MEDKDNRENYDLNYLQSGRHQTLDGVFTIGFVTSLFMLVDGANNGKLSEII